MGPALDCISANLTGCSNAQDLAFTYGSLIPSGVVNGIVVYFDGGDGTSAANVGEACKSVAAFNALSAAAQQDILDFLRSL